jgi:CBS domain containing-hemolysin-like protein
VLEPLLGGFGLASPVFAGAAAATVAFLLITVLHVVFGELAPKSVAIQQAERSALGVALPLRLFYWLAYPMIWTLNGAANWALRLVGLRPVGEREGTYSPDELRMLFLASSRRGVLPASERLLMERVFDFADRTVRQFMVPRPDIVYLSASRSLAENLQVARRHQHTRFPLCDGDIDRVIGMIHVKDLLPFERAEGPVDLARLRREILFVPETIRGDRLLREFQQRHLHMAIVVNEYGGTAGLVTLEDVLEELVGEIQDEFDREGPLLERRDDGSYLMDGAIGLDRAAEALGVAFEDEENATLAGHVLTRLGRPAHPGDRVELSGYEITVRGVRGLRVTKLLVTPAPAAPEPAPAEAPE